MDLKEVKNLAINLYRQGKTQEEIEKICDTKINEELIANWIQEDLENKNLKQITKLIKKMKKLKNIELNETNKDDIIKEIQEIAFEILKVDSKNELAMNELVRCYTIQKQYKIGRIYGEQILEGNPNNIFVLYNMAKLEIKARNMEKANVYNSRLLEIDKNNKQGNIQKKIIEEKIEEERKRQEEKRKQKEIEKKVRQIELEEKEELEQIKRKKSIEEEQNGFAAELVKEEKYTVENQKQYIENINKMFIEGKVNSKNIEKVKEELFKYPNKTESSLFLSELYYAITEKEEEGIDKINKFKRKETSLSEEEHKSLDEKISDFRKRIKLKEYLSKKEEEQKIRDKELKQEQREYSRQVIQRIDKGELKKEDIPEIVRNLERYPDRSKSIFLIMKLYEGFYDTTEALKFLAKYSTISNLTQSEIDSIIKMKSMLLKNKNVDTIKQRQQKIKKRNIASKKYKKNKEKDTKNQIETMLKEGKTVKAIQMKVTMNGNIISLNSINHIKNYLIKIDDTMRSKHEEKIEIAKNLVTAGFSVNEIYELLEADIGKSIIAEIRKEQQSKDRNL